MVSLYPFQEEAVKKMLYFLNYNESNAVYNAAEMGLGKCAMAVNCMNALAINKFIIICPAVMRLTWVDELKKWYEPFKLTIVSLEKLFSAVNEGRGASASIVLKTSDIARISKNNSIIISYDLASTDKFVKFVKETDGMYEMLIMDESHMLKNKRAKRTKAILGEIWPKCKYKIALSGTPFTQSVIDGYTLFSKMLPSKFPNFTHFAYRYSYQQMTPWGPKYFGVKNSEELSHVIRSNFYIRYKKEDVLKDLPDKVYQKVTLPTKYSVEVDEETQAAVSKAIQDLNDGRPVSIKGSLATHRRAQGLAKVEPITDYVEQLLEQEIPVVLFAIHRDVIGQLKVNLAKYNPVVITGDTKAENRYQYVKDFQEGKTNLFLANIAAAGVGITLTRSSNVVIGEVPWSPAELSQAIDRVNRIGAKYTTNVHYFVCTSSIDEKIIEVVMNKAKTFSKVIDSEKHSGTKV